MVNKCIKAGVLNLTKAKRECLDHEFDGFQWWMQFGVDKGILSQHKRAKGYNYKIIKYRTYPLVIPHNQVSFRIKKTKLTPYWIKISVARRKGIGVWLGIKPHKTPPDIKYLRDSLLIKNKHGNYELRLIYDVPQPVVVPNNILAIDLGERVIATVCDSTGNKSFLGRAVRGIRTHYAWLRKVLGKKKLLKKIKAVGQKEFNKVKNILHDVSNKIIEMAKENCSVIVVGKLKGIRKKNFNKKLNRILFNMPFFSLTRMIKYKATQAGLTVIDISEHYTSQSCHRCGHCDSKNRKSQGLFSCSNCNLQYNADLNAALNILNRAKEQDFLARAMAYAQKAGAPLSVKSISANL